MYLSPFAPAVCGVSGSSQERELLSAEEEDAPVCAGRESPTSFLSRFPPT